MTPRPPDRAPGLLLVEFCAAGRFLLAPEFPFLHAFARDRGLPSRWLRFALDPAVQFVEGRDGIGLPPGDLETLRAAAREARPSRVLFSQPPGEAVVAALRQAAPGADLAVLQGAGAGGGGGEDGSGEDGGPDGGPATAGAPRAIPPAGTALARWLCGDDETLAETVPHFGFEPANAAAREMAPLAFVTGPEECSYHRGFGDNPHYAGVDLSGGQADGCAFCVRPGPGAGDRAGAAVEPARQLAALLATHPFPSATARLGVRFAGDRMLMQVERLAALLKEFPGRPVDALMDARADHVLRQREALARAAADLAGTGHRVHVCLVGVENFSEPELQRMNKGFLPWQALSAIRALRELEARFPRSFGFREHGGLSTILFTPWTAPEDVALNLAVARHFRLEPLCGKMPTSRVRLYEGLPLTALARRDGLLADAYDDPALDTARRNFYPGELPWRFRDPRVEPLNRVLTRLQPQPALEGDALYRRVQAWARAATGGRGRPDAFALAEGLARRVLESPRPLAPEDLLGEGPAPAVAAPFLSILPDDAATVGAAVALLRAGLRRVYRLEGLPPASARDLARRLRRRVGAVREAPSDPAFQSAEALDLFLGPDAGEVEEAVRLTALLRTDRPPAEQAAAKERIGRLYGYPECCARAFAAEVCPDPRGNEFLLLRRRCEHPGEVSPLLSPFKLLVHVPCSYGCRASEDLARATLAVLRRALPARFGADFEQGLEDPQVFLLDRPGQACDLAGAEAVEGGFRFARGRVRSDDPRLQALQAGGEVLLSGGSVVARRGGRAVASFFLQAAPFWHRQAFDPEFWRQAALELWDPPPAPSEPAPSALSRALARFLAERLRPGGVGEVLAGFRVEAVEATAGRFASVRLARLPAGPRDPVLDARVEPLAGAGPHFADAGPYALGYGAGTALDADGRREALEALARRLATLR